MESPNPYQPPQGKLTSPLRKEGSCWLAFLWSIIGAILGGFVGMPTGMVFGRIAMDRLRAKNPSGALCGNCFLGSIFTIIIGCALIGGLTGAILYAFVVYRKRKHDREILLQDDYEQPG